MAINNPAARLLFILKKCRSVPDNIKNKPMPTGWRHVLNLPDSTPDTIVLAKVGLIYHLPIQIEAEIKRYEDLDTDLYLKWQNELTKAFTQINFTNQFAQFTGQLNETLLTVIQFCDHELSKRNPEKIIDESQLKEIKTSTEELFDKISLSVMDNDLKRFLLHHLYLIIEALQNYIITGAKGLETALDAAIGKLVIDPMMRSKFEKSEKKKDVWDILSKIALILSSAKTAFELGEGIAKLLSSGK